MTRPPGEPPVPGGEVAASDDDGPPLPEPPGKAPSVSAAETSEAETEAAAEAERPATGWVPDRRMLLALVVLALLTRLVWVLWIHPPADYVFSDMKKYVLRAQDLVAHGIHSDRTLAWQSWGTHYVLALPLKLFGKGALTAGAVTWALLAAAAVPGGYLLACRVSTRRWMPPVVGVALLLWFPNLSNSGYFLSEAPFLCFQLWSTLALVRVLQEGRGALGAGLLSAAAFAVRPQSALFFVLVLITWLINRRRLPKVRVWHLGLVAAPLLAMLAFSLWRFDYHTGQGLGVAENANMNLTAGRCHNIVTQAFRTDRHLRASKRRGNTRNGRRVSLPGFRVLARSVPPRHPLALRPAMNSETIRMVGYIGDAAAHRELRAECYRRTGWIEQARYSLVNVSLLYVIGHQWPEQSRGAKLFLPTSDVYKFVYLGLVWLPSLLGLGAALWWIARRPGLTFCAWQLLTSMTVAAVFFGTIRLRSPYDPYAMVLALEGWVLAALLVRQIARRLRA